MTNGRLHSDCGGNEGTDRGRVRRSNTGNPLFLSLSSQFYNRGAVSRVQVERRNLRNEWFVREPKKEEGDEEHVSKLEEN